MRRRFAGRSRIKGACGAGGAVDGNLFGGGTGACVARGGGRREPGEARDVVRLSPQERFGAGDAADGDEEHRRKND